MSLLNIGMSGLNAAQGSLSVLSNNIANANTAGYSRQQTIQSANASNQYGGVFIGSGTTLADVRRVYNEYLDTAYQNSTSLNSDAKAYLDQVSAVDKTLSDKTTGMSSVLSSFFAAVQTASANPSDTSARQILLTSAQTLSNRFNSISSQLSQQKETINSQLTSLTDQVNQLTSSIASLNKQITQVQGSSNTTPANLLDARAEAVRSLNELIGVNASEKNGVFSVSTGTGQSLVLGDRSNTLSAVPSKSDTSQYTIQMNASGGTAMDLGNVISGGSIGGLLRYRSDVLMPAINDLGRIAIVTADTINSQLGQGIDLNGEFGSSMFKDINSAASVALRSLSAQGNQGVGSLGVTIKDTSKLTNFDYKVTFSDPADLNKVTVERSDGKAMGAFDISATPPSVIDGFTLELTNGPMQAGDSFKVSPTASGAQDIGTVLNDPSKIAFAAPLKGEASKTNQGTGSFTPPTLTLPLDIQGGATTAQLRVGIENSMPVKMVFGKPAADGTQSYTLNDAKGDPIGSGTIIPGQANKITVNVPMRDASGALVVPAKSFGFDTTVAGSPTDGDSTTFSFNATGVSDNRNAQQLLNLQTKATVGVATDGTGGTSLVGANSKLVSTVGAKAAAATTDTTATNALLTANKNARNSVSQVNLDEEAGDMIKFQQYYTASSQIIKAAQETFSTLINSL
ncbi:flagellar hook-associated protein FlgK [Pseudomonas fluorescens group sp.]|uniref:Flagellar hook-associated protein 1 n=2 Tax=Pseudomonas fluorescens TaxID=294 RepID=C3K0V7_PSEFS|nr:MULTISPECIES: flagellar hook-associated protein FlgK [Pseudomonas fluorescens group]MBZ6455213.1 flagellar hook-associated protein FlgK [Pseudomonas fluorescens group sp.]MBZ6463134.1 flagellar hook-associated protein FlgK [Pseudomonas fluorescens group sp.]MBZ6468491.1 flagellar hook-associated protein FlgK [Pseudomonas fluorescens group sp.]WQD70768.1 flagellar hook-associated protein FlgK [Pseudomonas marginalis]CAI2798628.1 Flagellar hook-associated protein 1 [Pseudomonas fluorescens SB